MKTNLPKKLLRIATIAICATTALPVFADRDDDDDDKKQLVIKAVEPVYANHTLAISGNNLGRGASFAGTVRLFVPGQGDVLLPVTGFSAAEQEVTVKFPAALASSPGNYLLKLSTGSGEKRPPSTWQAQWASASRLQPPGCTWNREPSPKTRSLLRRVR